VPADVAFQTKPDLGLAMIREVGVWYLVSVPHDTRVGPPDDTTDRATMRTRADAVPADAWERHTIKDGRNGPIIADIVVQRVQMVRDGTPGPTVWLVLRWNPETGALKTYLSNAPADTPWATLVRMCGMRRPIEPCFETGKHLLGMGDDDVRSWRGRHHHMTLVILAQFFLVRMQIQLKKRSGPDRAAGAHAAGGRGAASGG